MIPSIAAIGSGDGLGEAKVPQGFPDFRSVRERTAYNTEDLGAVRCISHNLHGVVQ